jgi:hypothetical protein
LRLPQPTTASRTPSKPTSENRRYWIVIAKRTSNYLDKAKGALNEISNSHEQFWVEIARRAPTTQPAEDNVQSKKATAPVRPATKPSITTASAPAVPVHHTLNIGNKLSVPEQIGACFYLSRATQWLREHPQEITTHEQLLGLEVETMLQYLEDKSAIFVGLLMTMHEVEWVNAETLHSALDGRVSKDSTEIWLRLLLSSKPEFMPLGYSEKEVRSTVCTHVSDASNAL